ncbi:mucin-associated surface protein (MASP) [Trypanosoma cruzi Dm28c]|uniref:Mucin-associated surface protein (MASP) n=1 Tax=Trypanosoma cruzi Dm28c TaxID=1416333 RepID=V5AP32_TRYCR|nr:mucin-associated surface protein (MASP) [Trypanosoma cruzi Dm28c]
MAMMMTGRVLLVCALCVLWCGVFGIAADGAGSVDGSAVEYSFAGRHVQLRRECAEEVGRRTGGDANASAVEECLRQGMDGVRAVVDGRSRWRRQQFAVAAAADGVSGEVDINSGYSREDQSVNAAGSRAELQEQSPVVPESGQADTKSGGETLPKPAGTLETTKGETGGKSKEKDTEENPAVETKGPNRTNGEKQVGNAAIGNLNGDREEKNGATPQVQGEVVEPKEEEEVKKEMEEEKRDDPDDPGKGAEDTEDPAVGPDHKDAEGQKEEDAGKEQTTIGAKSHPEAPAAETEEHNREEVLKEEEDSGKATTNENFDGRQTAVKDDDHNEEEKTRQENENEMDKTEETTAEVKEKEETTEKKMLQSKALT